jgi:hypothetical protein
VTVKNILLKSLFDIQDKKAGRKPELMLADLAWDTYQQMQALSLESFQQNLQGPWELIELTGTQPNLQSAFRFVMQRTQELWREHAPCNILYTDPDTLCMKPMDIFGRFVDFRIFTDRDPLSQRDYHNCGVRYFPSTLTETFWNEINSSMIPWHDNVHYAFETDIYRHAMYTQQDLLVTPQGWVALQCGLGLPGLEQIPDLPGIWHLMASQGPENKLKIMQDLWKQIN